MTVPIPPPQNRTKNPRSRRSSVIVGQKWLYTARMTHNDENRPAERRAKWGKAPQPERRRGPLTRMAHYQVPVGRRDQAPAGRRAAEPRLTRMD